jgi:type II secretory pathway pseudopilin PulG
MRYGRSPHGARSRGFALMALLVLVTLSGLYFIVNNLTPEPVAARRQQQTSNAMNAARDALLGYALKYREDQIANGNLNRMYGYLPLPDLGTTRNNQTTTPTLCNPAGTQLEGCDALANTTNETVIGRFPWRTLGTGPLKDGNGECLWYVVSGSHDRIQRPAPMNWDTLSHLAITAADGSAQLSSALASAHDRPMAIIFSPGPALTGQDRSSPSPATDDVTECGGNYNAKNYLDPENATSLGSVINFFSGATNSATGATTALAAGLKKFSTQGIVQRDSSANLWSPSCPATGCTIVGNDAGLTLSGESFFSTLRNSTAFRSDINTMLDRMTSCLRDKIAGGSTPTLLALSGITSPTDKNIGRIPSDSCYDDATNPLGYFSNYQSQVFVATKVSNDFKVVVDGTENTCAAVLLFAGQRKSTQFRTSTVVDGIEQQNTPSNYLEGDNLSCFTTSDSNCFTSGAVPRFNGPSTFARVSSSHTLNQDIVRCVPNTASMTTVSPTLAAIGGNINLASYNAATQTIALGSATQTTNRSSGSALATSLSACAWSTEAHNIGTGLRSYFRFRIRRVGEGFTFAMIDGDRNDATVCGGARQHLGYSSTSGSIPYISTPKVGIEFDTSRNTGYTTTGTGRNDPASPIGSHVALVYWGAAVANATVTNPQHDDNVHGFPTTTESGARPSPQNPSATSYPRLSDTGAGGTDASQREFHARVELSASYNSPADPKDGFTTVTTKMWLEPVSAKSISAITFNAGSPPTLTVTVTPISASGHGLTTGDRVVIQDVVPPAYNGEYVATVIDSNSFTVTLPIGTAYPGAYITAICELNSTSGTTTSNCGNSTSVNRVIVVSANHGLNTGDLVTISGAVPAVYNVTGASITRIDANTYRFNKTITDYPGIMSPGIAAHQADTPNAIALKNTTRAMSQLDASFAPTLTETATIYDEQKSACAVSAPLCPSGQACGSDNMCYQPAFRNLRTGFTIGERESTTGTSRSALIEITDQATTWLP